MADETTTCPRRMQEIGPWKYEPNLDSWQTNRWLTDPEEVAKLHAEIEAKSTSKINWGLYNDLWLWESSPPPRTCSFCGGINPDDAIKLIEQGWEAESTYKRYKRYLNPPGNQTRHEAYLASCRDPNREPGQGVPSIWSPTPPVKLYVQHFSDDQIAKFNAIIQGRQHGN